MFASASLPVNKLLQVSSRDTRRRARRKEEKLLSGKIWLLGGQPTKKKKSRYLKADPREPSLFPFSSARLFPPFDTAPQLFLRRDYLLFRRSFIRQKSLIDRPANFYFRWKRQPESSSTAKLDLCEKKLIRERMAMGRRAIGRICSILQNRRGINRLWNHRYC